MKHLKLTFYSLVVFIFQFSLKAQINIPNLPFQYNQNFDSFGINNVNPWINDSTIPGWYVVHSNNGTGTTAPAFLFVDDGNGGLSFIFNFGTMNAPDRTLGSSNGDFVGTDLDWFYGAHFRNTSPVAINNITITYIGEQWHRSGMTPQTLRFFYRVGGNDFLANNTGWTALNLFDFVSPQTGAVSALNGNNVANQQTITANSTVFPNPITILPNEDFWIRWVHEDNLISGHGLGIDDFQITFTTNVINNPNPTNEVATFFSDIQLDIKKPKLTKTLKFKGANGFPFKTRILATISTPTNASYVAFATGNQPTNLTFTGVGKFKPIVKGKLAKKGVKAVAKHKGKTNKPGQGIAPDTASVTLIVKVDAFQGTNTGSVLFTNVITAQVK